MLAFCSFFLYVLKPGQNLRYADSDSESECSELNTIHKDKETVREKTNTKQIFSYNTEVV